MRFIQYDSEKNFCLKFKPCHLKQLQNNLNTSDIPSGKLTTRSFFSGHSLVYNGGRTRASFGHVGGLNGS